MRRNRASRTLRLAWGVALSLWLTAPGALAEETAPAAAAQAPAPAETPAPPPIEPIALEDVADRAVATSAALDSLRPDQASREASAKSAEAFEKRLAVANSRIQEISDALSTSPKVQTLTEIERQILATRQPLEERSKALDSQVSEISGRIAEVERQAEVWKKTAEAASGARPSPATLERIQSVRDKIREVRKVLIQRRNELLTLRDGLVGPRSTLDGLLERTRSEKQHRLGAVLSSTRSPIWSPQVRRSLDHELRSGLGISFSTRMEDLREYVAKQRALLVFEVALFLGLALALRMLKTRVQRELEQYPDLHRAAQVFQLPTAMALLISLALVPQLHALAPAIFLRLLGAVATVPVVLVVRRLVPATMTPLVLALVFFYLADRVRDIVSTLPTLERLILLLELSAGLVLLGWLLRPSRLSRVSAEMLRDPTFRTMGLAIRIAGLLLAIALLSDVFGFGDLADLLGTATLRSAYAALFLYAVTAVLQSLAAFLLLVRPLRLLRGLSRHRARVRRRVDQLFRLAGTLLWVYIVLFHFGIRDVVFSSVAAVLGATLSVGTLSLSLGDVLVFGLTVWVTLLLARLIHFTLEEDIYPRVRLARGVPYAISSLVRYSIFVLGFLAALATTGIELSKLTVIIGGLGLGIGFGLQNVVNNFVSGLILLFERPLQVGDTVQLPNLWGEITRIGIRASVVRTFDGAEVIVPNALLISDPVTNWTLSDQRRRLEVTVGVEYGTDAQRVIDLLLEVARANPLVMEDPSPLAYFMSFGDSSLDFMLRVWVSDFSVGYQVRSELAVTIQQALREAGISVPFPQRDLHLRTISPDAARGLSGSEPSEND